MKSTAVDPLSKEPISPLPPLPSTLKDEQNSLSELRAAAQPESPSDGLPSSSPVSPTSLYHRQSGRIKSKNHSTGLIRKRSSELLLNSDPESVMTRYFPPLESLTDPLEIVDRLNREPELGFLYLTPVEERKSVKYNPYNLR